MGQVIAGAPKIVAGKRHAVEHRGRRYRHFAGYDALVTYVEGEFPWEVRVGDVSVAHDYVDPPQGLSVEENPSPDGTDLTYTGMRHIEGTEVWKAFGCKGNCPRMQGVGPFRPNRWRKGRALTWTSFLVLCGLWVLLTLVYAGARDSKVVFEKDGLPVPYHDARNGEPNALYVNGGDFAFRDAAAELGLDHNNDRFSFAAAWEDFDNDGDQDLYVANDFGRNNLYRNDGGRLRDVASELGAEDISAGMGVTWGDADGDGWMDLYVTNM